VGTLKDGSPPLYPKIKKLRSMGKEYYQKIKELKKELKK
jgi:hypothetical protein